MNSFDEVVSLGYNCEISFRLENCFGKINSWPFSWSFILDRNLFLEALNHMDEIFQESVSICTDSRVNAMVQCDKYKICFHPRGQYVDKTGHVIEDRFFPEGETELKLRVKYLVEKFSRLQKDKNRRSLLICGIEEDDQDDTFEFITKLDEAIRVLFDSNNYVLLIVLPKSKYNKEIKMLESRQLKIRKIRHFGVQKCNDISTDTNGWGRIFFEFLGVKKFFAFYHRLTKHRIVRVYGAIKKRIH